MTELHDYRVSSRQHSVASLRAREVLSHSKLTFDDILYVLAALPVAKNTTRKTVIPIGEEFVHSQAIGLTTQRGYIPSLSSVCLKCPIILTLLSRFVLEYDPTYTFTTITLNYNYASSPHRDINHEDGKARIIALGEFTGGELLIHKDNGSSSDCSPHLHDEIVDIRNKWFDFDGRILHSTMPFVGERYSLVYFTHLASLDKRAAPVLQKLRQLCIPCPYHSISTIDPESNIGVDENRIVTIDLTPQSECSDSEWYFFSPNLYKNQQYLDAYFTEVSSLISLYFNVDISERTEIMFEENPNRDLKPMRFKMSKSSSHIILDIASRAVTFECLKEIAESTALESLLTGARESLPENYKLDILSYGKKLSTRQKRKVLMSLNLARSRESKRSSKAHNLSNGNLFETQLYLLLTYDSKQKDESGLDGVLTRAMLCRAVVPVPSLLENEFEAVLSDTDCQSTTDCPDKEDQQIIPSTPLKPMLCKLLCNLGKLSKGNLLYDPFMGSGSIFRIARGFGSICVGSDVKVGARDFDSFQCNIYHLPSSSLSSMQSKFDCVICDPPYGRRERHVNELGIDSLRHPSNEARAVDQFKIIAPLLRVSEQILVPGGRLVFLFMNYPNSDIACWEVQDLHLEQYPQLRFVNLFREQWSHASGHVLARDTVILEKISGS